MPKKDYMFLGVFFDPIFDVFRKPVFDVFRSRLLVIWNSLKIHEKNHFSKVSKKSEAVFRPYFRKNMKKVQKTSFLTPKTGILDVLTTKVALLWLVCQKWNPLKTVKTHFFQKFIKNDPFFRKSLKTLNLWFNRYEKWPFGLKSLTCEKL